MKKGVDLRTDLKANGWDVRAYEDNPDEGGLAAVNPKPSIDGLRIVCSWGGGWDHVSVSCVRSRRVPRYEEIEMVRKTCFLPDEVAVQYGVAAKDHVNIHDGCLHWWRPQTVEMPQPPRWMV